MEFPYISFSKGKEFNNEFDNLDGDVWLFFDIISTRKVTMEKTKAGKNVVLWKHFFL